MSSLGAGALAGNTLGLDASIPTKELGFSDVFVNTMDAVSDRDFAADLVYASAMFGVHLSRIVKRSFCGARASSVTRLSDEWSTGSSMMPQKRNPDMAELVRGRAALAIGDLTSLLALLKGLPLAYDRDLQEDKGLVFRAADRAADAAVAMRHVIGSLTFDEERMAHAAGEADYLGNGRCRMARQEGSAVPRKLITPGRAARGGSRGTQARPLRGPRRSPRRDPSAADGRSARPGRPGCVDAGSLISGGTPRRGSRSRSRPSVRQPLRAKGNRPTVPNLSEMHKRSIAALFALGLVALPGRPPLPTARSTQPEQQVEPGYSEGGEGQQGHVLDPTQQPHDFKPYKGPWPKKKAVWLYEGESVSYKLAEKGKYLFRCFLHSEMDAGECTGMCGSVTTK